MSYRDFVNDIKSGNIKKVYLLHGKESYLLDKAKELLRDNVVTAFPELNLSILDGEHLTVEQLQNACETFPFGCEKRLIIVRQPAFLKKASGKGREEVKDVDNKEQEDTGGGNSTEVKRYLELLQELSDTCCLLLLYYGELGKSKKMLDAVSKDGAIYELKKAEKDELVKWIKNSLSKQNKKIGFKELDYLVGMTGYNDKNSEKTLYDLENEINKIAAFSGSSEDITIDHISAVMPRSLENDIFKLINSCADKKPEDGLTVLNDLLMQGEEIFSILAMLTKQIRTMIAVLELNQRGMDAKSAALKLKVHEFYAKNCLSYGKKIGMHGLIKGLNNSISSELDSKTGKMDKRLALELLMINMFQ